MMDEKVAERRRGVSEDKARRRLRWVLGLLAFVLIAAGGIWLIRSPFLSIDAVEITGAEMSDPAAVVAELEMGVGRPTIDVDAGTIRTRILEDPWVAAATVSVVWPSTLVVDVVEYEPTAPVQAGDEWFLAASDGAIIAPVTVLTPDIALVAIDSGPVEPGDVVEDPFVLGALAYVDATVVEHRVGLRLRVADGALVAEVGGHTVMLGRPVEIAAKARVVDGLIADGLEPGATINAVAPSRPAVTNPPPQPEVEE